MLTGSAQPQINLRINRAGYHAVEKRKTAGIWSLWKSKQKKFMSHNFLYRSQSPMG